MALMLIPAILLSLICVSIGRCVFRVHQADQHYQSFNNQEWKIDGLPWPIYWVRFLNANGFGCGPSCFVAIVLWLIDKLLVQPALQKSLHLMELAEQAGTVPAILCNAQARHDMKERVQTFHDDLQSSQTLTPVAKVLNYSGAYMCLCHHSGLLALGLQVEVHQEQVVEPVFIVSLPRTGTTILHRTMAHDRERFRNFDLCDMIAPLHSNGPVARWDVEGRQALADHAQTLLDQLDAIYPGLADCLETMHGFRVNEADEDLGWYDTGLGHMYMDPLMKLAPENRRKPRGCSGIEGKDVANYRYAWLAMIMRIYQTVDKFGWEQRKQQQQSTSLEERMGEDTPLAAPAAQGHYDGPCPTEHLPWLMKDPNHSAYLPELLQVFPDAKFVFTHRAPADIVPSMAKLFVCFCSVEHIPGAPGTTAREWGQEVLRRTKHYLDGMVDFTKQQQQQGETSDLSLQKVGRTSTSTSRRRIDFNFSTVVQDVPGTIDHIYAQFYPDAPSPSPEAKHAFAAYLTANEREKHGNQRRSLQDFHLTTKDVAFTEYKDMFLSF